MMLYVPVGIKENNKKNKEREERRLVRRKKRQQERREREAIEMNGVQTFFLSVKRLTEGFKPGASSCRDERGNLVTDAQEVQRLWRHHFSTLLRGDINAATREDTNRRRRGRDTTVQQ